MTLENLKERMEEIAGNWNGEDSEGEEEAGVALEVIEHIEAIEASLVYLGELSNHLEARIEGARDV